MPTHSPPTNAPPSVEAGAFLQTILRSGLLAQDQLQAALRALPPERQTDSQAIANHLVKNGKLTRFQAAKLLEGAIIGLVLGPYHVLAPIGRGGFGAVFLARDTRNQELLALKVLPPKRAREEDHILARFRREMEICRRVAHPNLTQTFDAGVHQGVYYIAMEYIPGKNLYRLVTDEGPLAVPRAARLFAEVAAGLEHAHGQGLIHRDLKPSNLIVTPADHIKILDLGLALVENEIASDVTIVGGAGYVVGTMDYIAPEQAEDASKVTARSDIYGLGCTLYFALTGQPPFPGGTSQQKMARHRTEEPIPVTDLNPTVPVGFSHLLRRLMAKRPEKRFPSAAAVREELLAWADQAPTVSDQLMASEFQQAVASLQATDVSPGQVWERIARVSSAATGRPSKETDPGQPLPFWLDYLLPVSLGVFVWLAMYVALLIWLLRG